jgi:hypothetical protein
MVEGAKEQLDTHTFILAQNNGHITSMQIGVWALKLL